MARKKKRSAKAPKQQVRNLTTKPSNSGRARAKKKPPKDASLPATRKLAGKTAKVAARPATRPKAKPTDRPRGDGNPLTTVKRVHFEDFDGHEFERLVLAYMWRWRDWKNLEWYGEVGQDGGRDIVGETNDVPPRRLLVLCANRQRLTFTKVRDDLTAAIKNEGEAPYTLVVASGHAIPSSLRDRIKALAAESGVVECERWSGADFEERLRKDAEPLLERFCEGKKFPEKRLPDEPGALRSLGDEHCDKGASQAREQSSALTVSAGSINAARDVIIHQGVSRGERGWASPATQPQLSLLAVSLDEQAIDQGRNHHITPVRVIRAYVTNRAGTESATCRASAIAIEQRGRRQAISPIRLFWEGGLGEVTIPRGDDLAVMVGGVQATGSPPRFAYVRIGQQPWTPEFIDEPFTVIVRLSGNFEAIEVRVPVEPNQCVFSNSDSSWMQLYDPPRMESSSGF